MNFKIIYKYILSILLVVITLTSCKSELEKIDINNLDLQKAYQNKIIDTSKNSISKLNSIKQLISEYRKLEKENINNANFNFLIGRLYVKGANLPLYEIYFDSLNNKFTNKNIYETFIDSAIYYNLHSLELDKNQIHSMTNLCNIVHTDIINNTKSNQQSFLFTRSPDKFNILVNYIANNFENFLEFKGDTNRKMSQYIAEVGLYMLTAQIDNDKTKELDLNDANVRGRLSKIKVGLNYLNKVKEFGFLTSDDYKNKQQFYNTYVKKLDQILEEERIESQFNLIDIKHKYSNVNADAGIFGMLELYTNSDYTQAVGGYGESQSSLLHGRGSYSRSGHEISFSSSGGISFTGKARLDFKKNKLIITLPTGAVYVQDDEGYFIKNIISTKGY